jgi:hypothetical protein
LKPVTVSPCPEELLMKDSYSVSTAFISLLCSVPILFSPLSYPRDRSIVKNEPHACLARAWP